MEKRGVKIQTDSGDGGDDFAKLELIQDGGFSRRIKSDHQDAHLLLGEEPIQQIAYCQPHTDSCLNVIMHK